MTRAQYPIAPEAVVSTISNICPVCNARTDVSDGGAGDELTCTSCGVRLVIEEWQDGTFSLVPNDDGDTDG